MLAAAACLLLQVVSGTHDCVSSSILMASLFASSWPCRSTAMSTAGASGATAVCDAMLLGIRARHMRECSVLASGTAHRGTELLHQRIGHPAPLRPLAVVGVFAMSAQSSPRPLLLQRLAPPAKARRPSTQGESSRSNWRRHSDWLRNQTRAALISLLPAAEGFTHHRIMEVLSEVALHHRKRFLCLFRFSIFNMLRSWRPFTSSATRPSSLLLIRQELECVDQVVAHSGVRTVLYDQDSVRIPPAAPAATCSTLPIDLPLLLVKSSNGRRTPPIALHPFPEKPTRCSLQSGNGGSDGIHTTVRPLPVLRPSR